MANRRQISRALLLALVIAASMATAAEYLMVVTPFSSSRPGIALPAGWEPSAAANVKIGTRYALVDDAGTTVLRADSSGGASGLTQQLRIRPEELPWLRWRWKINNVIEQADLRSKEGDDFPARLYVMFDYPLEKLPFIERNKLRLARALFDPNLPAATLCYVWDGKAARETIAPSAYTDRVKLIVVESGTARVKQWVNFERNVARDFRAAFGEDAPSISGIAVATDTDNTGATAISFFGNISFNKQRLENKTPMGSAQP